MSAGIPPETQWWHYSFGIKVKHRNRITKNIILSGLVLVYDVILLAKSVDICLPISAPKPVNKPAPLKPTAESAGARIYPIQETPAVTMSSLTMFF